jgi:hypothetical protein
MRSKAAAVFVMVLIVIMGLAVTRLAATMVLDIFLLERRTTVGSAAATSEVAPAVSSPLDRTAHDGEVGGHGGGGGCVALDGIAHGSEVGRYGSGSGFVVLGGTVHDSNVAVAAVDFVVILTVRLMATRSAVASLTTAIVLVIQ